MAEARRGPQPLWSGRPQRADLLCWGGLVLSGLYGLVLTPLKPLLIGRPLLLELVGGSMSAMVTAGAYARVGRASLVLALLAGIPGSMMFDPLYWWAGRRWGRRVVHLFAGVGRRRERALARAERLFHRYGPAAIVLGYFLPIPVTIIYAFAGWSGMRLRTFVLLDLCGTLLWVGTLVGLGYWIGHSAVRAADTVAHYGLLISIVLIVVVVGPSLWRMRAAAPGAEPAPVPDQGS